MTHRPLEIMTHKSCCNSLVGGMTHPPLDDMPHNSCGGCLGMTHRPLDGMTHMSCGNSPAVDSLIIGDYGSYVMW